MSIDLQTIADRIAIEERLFLYGQYLDTGRPERVAEQVFTEGGALEFGSTSLKGRDAIHAHVMQYAASVQATSHNIGNIIVELHGDRAHAVSRVIAYHWFAIPGADPLRPTDLLSVGGYEDDLVRTAEGWRIQRRRGHNFGTGAGAVPEPMRGMVEGMLGIYPGWPA